jgi:hypothetical protein
VAKSGGADEEWALILPETLQRVLVFAQSSNLHLLGHRNHSIGEAKLYQMHD